MAFTVANLAGSGLNYLFQVHAAAVLDARAFGLLSAWLAIVTSFGVIVTFVQFLSLEARMDDARWPAIARLAGFGALAVLVLHLVTAGSSSPLALGATAVVGGIALGALVGQLQARLALGIIAASVIATTGLRFGLPFAWARADRAPGFYLAHAASSYAGMIVIGLAALRGSAGPRAAVEAAPRAPVSVGRPLLLGFATAVFPYIDVLAISATQDAATTGELSRIVLVARAIFYGGLAGLGVLFPHQLHTAKTGEPMPAFAVFLERFLPAAVVSGAVPAAIVLDALVLHTTGEQTTWLYASSLAGAASIAILGEANRYAALGRLRAATWSIAGTILASAAGAALSQTAAAPSEQVTRYTAVAFCGNALVLVAARAMRGR